jgi:hypothetical protein
VRVAAALALGAALLLGACGGGGDDHSASTTTAVTVGSTTVTTFGGIPGSAQSLACSQDARTVQQAADLYTGLHGSPAPSIDVLVADGGLEQAPATDHGYVIAYDPQTGAVTATGACTYP